MTLISRRETIGLPRAAVPLREKRRETMGKIANRVWFRIVSRMMAGKATKVEVNVILPIASHLIGF